MKVNPLAIATTIGFVPYFTRAFANQPLKNNIVRSFATRTIVSDNSLFKINNTSESVSSSTTSRPMIFKKLFSAVGGGYSAKIDYTVLPYPCTDLATAAQDGKVPEEMVSKDGKKLKVATFAGGCFWGVELAYQRVPGVEYTAVGYTQGPELEPTYDQVCSGGTGHTEAVCVLYDPSVCKYESLLDTFFNRVNPLTVNGQGNDYGRQYRTGVYYHSEEQAELAKARFASEQTKYGGKKIASECMKALPFWPAEKYHQQYLEKGGRFNSPQSASKGCTDPIRCYG